MCHILFWFLGIQQGTKQTKSYTVYILVRENRQQANEGCSVTGWQCYREQHARNKKHAQDGAVAILNRMLDWMWGMRERSPGFWLNEWKDVVAIIWDGEDQEFCLGPFKGEVLVKHWSVVFEDVVKTPKTVNNAAVNIEVHTSLQ